MGQFRQARDAQAWIKKRTRKALSVSGAIKVMVIGIKQARAEIEAKAFARAQEKRAVEHPEESGPPAPPEPKAKAQYN